MHLLYFEKEGRDDRKLGEAVAALSGSLLTSAPAQIKESGLPCVNITYNNLVKDPIAVVKSIYKEYDWNFTVEYEAILTKYLDDNKKDRESKKKGKQELHTYRPEEFGLTEELLSQGKFAQYCETFNIPMSRN